MCQSLSGGVQGLPQGTQIKASVKERETISITVEPTERETDTKTKRKRLEEGKRERKKPRIICKEIMSSGQSVLLLQ